MNEKDYDKLKDMVDDTVTTVYIGHIFRGDVDKCLEYFGEQDEECIKHNLKIINNKQGK
jgi:hypothetical protein